MLTHDELPRIERFDPTGRYCLGILFGEITGNRKTQQNVACHHVVASAYKLVSQTEKMGVPGPH